MAPEMNGPTDPSFAVAPNKLSIQQKYAWDWFSYHANQRMTALNFFFVTVGIFAVAYSKCVEHQWRVIGALVGVFGFVTSIAFCFLDVRNEELVNCARQALDTIEGQLELTIRSDDHKREFLRRSTGWLSKIFLAGLEKAFPETEIRSDGQRDFWAGDFFAHRFWLRTLQCGAALVFLAGAIFAGIGYPR